MQLWSRIGKSALTALFWFPWRLAAALSTVPLIILSSLAITVRTVNQDVVYPSVRVAGAHDVLAVLLDPRCESHGDACWDPKDPGEGGERTCELFAESASGREELAHALGAPAVGDVEGVLEVVSEPVLQRENPVVGAALTRDSKSAGDKFLGAEPFGA